VNIDGWGINKPKAQVFNCGHIYKIFHTIPVVITWKAKQKM
jgi:hypothetical protein